MDECIRLGDRDTQRQAKRWIERIQRWYLPGVYKIRPYKDVHSGYERFSVERVRDGSGDIALHRLFGW